MKIGERYIKDYPDGSSALLKLVEIRTSPTYIFDYNGTKYTYSEEEVKSFKLKRVED